MSRSHTVLLGLVVLGWLGAVSAVYRLRALDTIYMPRSYDPPVYEYLVDAAEQFAYDPNAPIVYIVGNDNIHVIDISTPGEMQNIAHETLGLAGEFTDIEACGNWVAAGFDNDADPLDGRVYIYRTYDASIQGMQLLHVITVGSLPDMVLWTQDCKTLLVAVEGELRVINGQVVDPEGAVGIIKFENNPDDEEPIVQIADFNKFNAQEDDYVQRGVRRVYSGQNAGITTTFAQDLEPEYIQFNEDDTIGYVVLQENNAMAIVDVQQGEVVELYPLGLVDHAGGELDPSDRDGGIRIAPWMVSGIRNPDGFKYMSIDGSSYILTSNEGDEKDYEFPNFEWAESARGNYFANNGLIDSSVDPDLEEAIGDNELLGRLRMSLVDTELANGRYADFLSYGSRSFSVFDASDFSLLWDSGSELEREVERSYPTIFNSNPNSPDDSPESSMDTRSDNKGPEPESMEYARVGQDILVFIGCERPGFVAIYKMINNGPNDISMEFQSLHYAGGYGSTWRQLWEMRVARDLDPEDIKYLGPEQSPTGTPLLGVSGSYSGTFSLYEVYDDGIEHERTIDSGASKSIFSPLLAVLTSMVVMLISMVHQ